MSKKPENEAVIYWEQHSYSVVDSSELHKLPIQIQKMIINGLLQNLNIEISVR